MASYTPDRETNLVCEAIVELFDLLDLIDPGREPGRGETYIRDRLRQVADGSWGQGVDNYRWKRELENKRAEASPIPDPHAGTREAAERFYEQMGGKRR